MGFLKNMLAGEPAEPTFSRQWIDRHGPISRKNELAMAALNRVLRHPAAAASTFGQPLDAPHFAVTDEIMATVLVQDRSLAGCVARDLALLFESFGGLALNLEAAHQAVGLEADGTLGGPYGQLRDEDKGFAQNAAQETLSVARTIQARDRGQQVAPGDLGVYTMLFESEDESNYRRALRVGGWAATSVARMRTGGHIDGELPTFADHLLHFGQMEQVGWYPNPINAGDTSLGDASIERWWDGRDWTDRVRLRENRRWQETRNSIFTVPDN